MKILWIAHSPFGITRTRTEHLVGHLTDQAEIHLLTFSCKRPWQDWGMAIRCFLPPVWHGDRVCIHEIPRLPYFRKLNGIFLNYFVRLIVKQYSIDAVIISPNQYFIGRLDFSALAVPVICDYLDGFDWAQLPNDPCTAREREYVEKADTVLCVSHGLTQQSRRVAADVYYVPNGVDLGRYREFIGGFNTAEEKARLGLDPGALTISVIGLTCSPTLYFVDAVKRLREEGLRVQLMLVGDGPILDQVRDKFGGIGDVALCTGRVPYHDILRYFAVTDIGLYPVDENSYYHWASPLKVFEYAAMGKPVIISPALDELSRVGLSNFHFCENSAGALAAKIREIQGRFHDVFDERIDAYDWQKIAKELGCILENVVERHRMRATAARQPR